MLKTEDYSNDKFIKIKDWLNCFQIYKMTKLNMRDLNCF